MSEHYFTNRPTSDMHTQELNVELADIPLTLTTSEGVFSKNRVDYGSKVLVETFLANTKEMENKSLLELGSGYGPIIITIAKKFPQSHFTGVEVNERAFELAQTNAKANNVDINFVLEDATVFSTEQAMDFVLTNPPIRAGKQTIQQFVTNAFELLADNGELWLVIQKKQGAPSMVKHMKTIFGNVEKVVQDKGYWILKSVK